MASKRDKFDRGSKWLLAHHGAAILRLTHTEPVRAWKAVQPEVVQPRHLPDGLLEVYFQRRKTADYFLIEIATYPERRLLRQVREGTSLVFLDRGTLPEVLTVVLRPKGQFQVGGKLAERSRLGWTEWLVNWRVIELWTVPAQQLLATGDVGLIPWVPLTQSDNTPKVILEQCRERIDAGAKDTERANLLAVTQIMSQLVYNDPGLFAILGGRQTMIESPLVGEIRTEAIVQAMQTSILTFLKSRFGPLPEDVRAQVRTITNEKRLHTLTVHAARCKSLKAFRDKLSD